MKRSRTIFLQVLVILIGIVTLGLMLWEPQLEGVNAHATQFEIYFKDPFLAYAYTASIAFYVAVFQTFKILGYVGQNQTNSPATLKALRTIKYCGLLLVACIGSAVAYLMIVRPGDDIAGGVAMGLFLTLIVALIATTATMFERRLRNSVDVNPKTT